MQSHQPAHAFGFTPVDFEGQYSPPALPGIADAATRFAYNRDMDLTQVSRPDGSSIALAYNTLGQFGTVTPAAGAGNAVTYGYAVATGQLTSIATADTALSMSYDGPLITQEAMSGAVAASLNRNFDANFRVTGLSFNGVSSAYGYDYDGLLTQAGPLAITRDPGHGMPTGSTLGNLITSQGYNGFGELASFSGAHGATPLLSYTLGYDKGGRIISKTETVLGVTTAYSYGYDAAGRLASVSRAGSVVASYGYDANGNRTQQGGVMIASVDAQDRLLSYGAASYLYTAHGSLREKTQGTHTTRYGYDAFGNLKSVELPSGGRIDYLVDGAKAHRQEGQRCSGAGLRVAGPTQNCGNRNRRDRWLHGGHWRRMSTYVQPHASNQVTVASA